MTEYMLRDRSDYAYDLGGCPPHFYEHEDFRGAVVL